MTDEPRPLAVQIWDNDPETLAAVGARLAHEFRVSVVDINFGCPVKQVTREGPQRLVPAEDPDRMGAIIERVVRGLRSPTPVTAKIRLGCTREQVNAIDVAQAVEGAGAAALTVHGRTAQDFFTGSADWDRIAAIKPHLKRIPLIGNGDLDSPREGVRCLSPLPVDGVMIARAALAKPWLFRAGAAALAASRFRPTRRWTKSGRCCCITTRWSVERFGPDKGHDPDAQVRLLLRPRPRPAPASSAPACRTWPRRGSLMRWWSGIFRGKWQHRLVRSTHPWALHGLFRQLRMRKADTSCTEQSGSEFTCKCGRKVRVPMPFGTEKTGWRAAV